MVSADVLDNDINGKAISKDASLCIGQRSLHSHANPQPPMKHFNQVVRLVILFVACVLITRINFESRSGFVEHGVCQQTHTVQLLAFDFARHPREMIPRV